MVIGRGGILYRYAMEILILFSLVQCCTKIIAIIQAKGVYRLYGMGRKLCYSEV
jgi:hypothetical protein